MFPTPFLLICPSPCGISLSGHAQQFIFIRSCVRVASSEEPCVLNFHFPGFPALFFFFLKESPPHLIFRDQVGSTCPRSRSKQLELLLQRERRVILTHDQCWAPKPILGSVRFLLTDRRMYSVVGYLKQITETETDNFPVGYSVGYFTWTFFLCHVRTPMLSLIHI